MNYECSDSPTVVILPDCSTVELTTCFCEAPDPAYDVPIVLTHLEDTAEEGTLACTGALCVPNGNLAGSTEIYDVVEKIAPGLNPNNATPAPKGQAEIDCDDCAASGPVDGVQTVYVDWDLADNKKNNHFDIVLVWGEGPEDTCTVGLNVHTQACDEEPEP